MRGLKPGTCTYTNGAGWDLDSTKFAGSLWPRIPDAVEAALSPEATELGLWEVEALAASAAEGTGLAV